MVNFYTEKLAMSRYRTLNGRLFSRWKYEVARLDIVRLHKLRFLNLSLLDAVEK